MNFLPLLPALAGPESFGANLLTGTIFRLPLGLAVLVVPGFLAVKQITSIRSGASAPIDFLFSVGIRLAVFLDGLRRNADAICRADRSFGVILLENPSLVELEMQIRMIV